MITLENKEEKIRIVKNESKRRKLTRDVIYIDNDYSLRGNIRRSVVEEKQREFRVVLDGREWK